MSFYAVAVGVVGEGVAAGILGGAMMGATTTVASNVIGGRDPFDNIGRGVVMGGLTGGLTPGVAAEFSLGMPAAAGITSFGLNTLATGDLGKGLAAGATAYGLYGLGESVAGMGTNSLTGTVLGDYTSALAEQGIFPTVDPVSGVVNPAYGNAASKMALSAKDAAGSMSITDKMSAGWDAVGKNPGTFLKDNAKNLMYTAVPLLADAGVKSNMPTTTTRPGAMRRFSYDPYGQIYTPIGNYEVPVKAAGGGLMGMDDGGYSPGQLNFAERSEPVVRMARGGVAQYEEGGLTADQAQALVEAQYATIGRSGVGTGAAQIDQAGLQGWTDALVRGDLSAADLGSRFGTAVTDYMAQNPADQYTQYVQNYQANQAGTGANATTGGVANLATTGGLNNLAAANNITNVTTGVTSLADAQGIVNNMYRTVLGRDADPTGLNFWSNAIASGRSPESIYQDFLTSARANTELVREDQIKNKTFAEATTPYKGYMSSDATNIVDEWVRTTLGREPTDADKQQSWYKDAFNKMTTQGEAQGLFGQFKTYAGAEATKTIADRIKAIDAELKAKNLTETDLLAQTGKTKQQLASEGLNTGLNLMSASQLTPAGSRTAYDLKAKLAALKPVATTQTVLGTNSQTNAPAGTTNPYGNINNPGDITFNPDGSRTITPNIPGRPYGGFSGISEVKDAYTRGGGSLGYIPDAPKTIEEFEAKYNTLTGGSRDAYDYLTGKTKYSATPYTETGEVMKPYVESVLGRPLPTSTKRVLFDPVTKTYRNNPDYVPVSYTDKGKKVYGLSGRDIAAQLPAMDAATSDYEKWMKDNNVTYAQIAEAFDPPISIAEAKKRYPAKAVAAEANGGLMAMAGGGMAQQFDLGGYSDGGRLLRGPGDGVSDSIPATIGNKRPARLADGEFVVPARIVSELGNGSTEAGARKLYAMMDRVQAARRGSIGKGKVAKNSRADKYLPA